MSETIPIDSLHGSRAFRLLSWPSFDEALAEERLRDLRLLGVDALILGGPHLVSSIRILGKGHVGIVVAAKMGEMRAALKVRRTDADRATLRDEAELLGLANSVRVGPELLGCTDDLLLMELIEGWKLSDPRQAVRHRLVNRASCSGSVFTRLTAKSRLPTILRR